jgi:hypothetical protein
MRRVATALLRTVSVALLLGVYALSLRAQQTPGFRADGEPRGTMQPGAAAGGETAALTSVLLEHFRLGSGHYVLHCRRAHGGCEARARRMAALFVRAGRDHDVDAWLLAAIALRESGGNPDAIGARGEIGLMQLHPQSRAGRLAAQLCAETPAHCPAIQIDGAARVLRASIDTCGSVDGALARYNSGACDSERGAAYARAVLARLERLRGAS